MKEIYIVIKEFDEKLAKRQPWYSIRALKILLIQHNIKVHIVSSTDSINESYTGVVLKVWSLKDLFFFTF